MLAAGEEDLSQARPDILKSRPVLTWLVLSSLNCKRTVEAEWEYSLNLVIDSSVTDMF